MLPVAVYARSGGTADLCVYQTTVAQNIYNQNLKIDVIHDDNAHKVYVYVNGVLKHTRNDTDAGQHPTHYFKYGVYQLDEATACIQSWWWGCSVWKK